MISDSHIKFHYLALNQSTARLHQVINYNNMTIFRISLFYPYNSLFTLSNFVTYNLQKKQVYEKQLILQGNN